MRFFIGHASNNVVPIENIQMYLFTKELEFSILSDVKEVKYEKISYRREKRALHVRHYPGTREQGQLVCGSGLQIA